MAARNVFSRNRNVFIGLGVGAAAFGGYYLYTAGGNPRIAEKQMERDAARLSRTIKSEIPGAAKEAKTDIKLNAQQLGSKIDSTVESAKAQGRQLESSVKSYANGAERKLEQAKRDTANSLNKAVDTFDKKVEEGASQAKSGISSWFK